MTMLPRRLTFQLTPLLDLLLIVIFAQYMEVQQTDQMTKSQSARDVAASEAKLQESERTLKQLQREKQTSEADKLRTAQEQQRIRAETAQQQMELTRALQQAIQQRDLVGELVLELFQVPDEIVAEILTPRSPSENFRSDQEVQALKTRFRSMKRLTASEIAKHLLTYEELRKRCDIWDVYVDANGVTTFTIGKDTHEFRANTSEDFEKNLFERYKASPQPKGLVIILLSYGDTRASIYEAAVNGLPDAAGRMRADSNARTRYEYAILGYSPKKVEQ